MISIVSGGINGLPICIQIAPGKIYAMSMSTLPRVEPFQGALKSWKNGTLCVSSLNHRRHAWDTSGIGGKSVVHGCSNYKHRSMTGSKSLPANRNSPSLIAIIWERPDSKHLKTVPHKARESRWETVLSVLCWVMSCFGWGRSLIRGYRKDRF